MTEKNNREVRASYPRRYRAQFGENLKKKLKERRISQATLAKEIGVSRTCVGFWCNGHTIPCNERLEQLACFLETSPRRLLGCTLDSRELDDIWANRIAGV
mgnify:FL=1|jgi:transcriptional regulator with XRE-family HTH domain